jgi:hypothetical protein
METFNRLITTHEGEKASKTFIRMVKLRISDVTQQNKLKKKIQG